MTSGVSANKGAVSTLAKEKYEHRCNNETGMILFGFYCLLIGCLIFRSNFLPRILGILVAFAGIGHLTGTFANLLSPVFAQHLLPYIMLPGLVGEVSLMLWLLVMGVNASKWKEQASVAQ